MDAKHHYQKDPGPKRRKDKDNPYTIFTVGKNTDSPHYYISFRDGQNIPICLEISASIYHALDTFELEDISYLHKVDKYISDEELDSIDFTNWDAEIENTPEKVFLKRADSEMLQNAIKHLPEVQRRRLVLYYFGGYTYEQIALSEGCTLKAVHKAVLAGIANLKRALSDS